MTNKLLAGAVYVRFGVWHCRVSYSVSADTQFPAPATYRGDVRGLTFQQSHSFHGTGA